MASKRPFLEEDFSCPICCSVFSDPVLLLCGHSGCKECIENYWRVKKLKECPLCRKVSITKPPPNLALRNLCHAFLDYQKQLEELCEVHHDKLSLFCDDDEQLVCERCRDFGEHKFHTFRPICEVAEENKVLICIIFIKGYVLLELNNKMFLIYIFNIVTNNYTPTTFKLEANSTINTVS